MATKTTGNPCSKEFTFIGKVAGVNEWHGARAIKTNKKWIAMLYENKKYKDFKYLFGSQAALLLRPVKGYLDIVIHIWMWKIRDTDGPIKPILDALEDFKIIENDKYIRNITIIRNYHKKSEPDMIVLFLSPLEKEVAEFVNTQQEGGYVE